MTQRLLISSGLIALASALGACSSEQEELRAWMEQTRQNTQPIHEVIAEPKKFEPFRYEDIALVDPFSLNKLQAAYERLVQRSKTGISPDLNRRRDPLEAFPLEQIHMVGHLSDGRQNFALLQVENLVYQARIGNYAGQNFGKITGVSDNQVKLKELVQDAAGEWIERESSLQLQEGSRK